MNRQAITLGLSIGCALSFASPSLAVYTGLQVVGTPVIAGGMPRTMYRVYATFTDANDYLTVANGSPNGSTMVIQSRNSDDTGSGSNFFNPIVSHGTPPTPLELNGGLDGNGDPIPPVPDAMYDTFFTIAVGPGQIGLGPGGDNGIWSQGMPNDFINGNAFTASLSGWFHPLGEQGRAGWLGDGDPLLRVLIMQLTVDAGDNVRGTFNISGVNQTAMAGATSFTISGQTFNSIPSPGGLIPLTAVAVAFGRDRRRPPHTS